MVISSRTMGISQPDPELTSHDGALDEQYHRIKNDPHNTAGLPYEGTTQQITELHMRHFIMRETPRGSLIAAWINAMNEVAEGTRLGVPVLVAATARLGRKQAVGMKLERGNGGHKAILLTPAHV
jgi:beta-glucosidase